MNTPQVCEHLQGLLNDLLTHGAEIVRVETSWSEAELVVVLDRGLTPALGVAKAQAHGVEFWRNDDAHYSIEFGCFCNTHKQGLSWPQDQATIGAL